MRRKFRLEPLLHALLAGAALAPALSCGGSSVENPGAGGTNSEKLGVCDKATASDASGWISCDGAYFHREAAGRCGPFVPRPESPGGGCLDASCSGLLYGHCWAPPTGALYWQPTCVPGCVSDTDCASNEVCFCEDPVGRCIPADCSIDADCGPNAFCSTYVGPENPSCSFYVAGAACQTEGDACIGNECNCAMVGGERACVQGIGGCGRPFLVDGSERRAHAEPRGDWSLRDGSLAGNAPNVAGVSPSALARLREHWTLAGLLEHASIAAFARFSLELLALGAPAELVADASRAMVDETRHAEVCFGFASAYGPGNVGPGPLAVSDCLGTPTLESVVKTALLEGCIGETVAAAEARELARTVDDPLVRDALELIASDETRHAALAYRFVRWALERGGRTIAALVSETLAAERARARRSADAHDQSGEEAALLALGVPTAGFRASLRKSVVERVVTPCLDALVRETRRTPGASADPRIRRGAESAPSAGRPDTLS